MATKNAPFYSCKGGRPDTLKSHRLYQAALKAAGEFGQVWNTENGSQRQVHESAAGGWMTAKPDADLAVDLKPLLLHAGLIDADPEDEDGFMQTFTGIPSIEGLFWYYAKDASEPEPVAINPARWGVTIKSFSGKEQSWMRDGEYLVGPQPTPAGRAVANGRLPNDG